MFNDAVGFKKIFRKVGYTDFRKGIPGLAAMIRESFGYDPYEKNILFLFCGHKADRIKGLVFEGDGFCLVYKRLMEGLTIMPKKKRKVVKHKKKKRKEKRKSF